MAEDPYKYFRVEARELVDELVKATLELEKGAPGAPAVARILRAAHTLKGAARVVKQGQIADRAHALEDVLGPYRETTEPVSRAALATAFELLDRMNDLVAALASPNDVDASSHARVRADEPARTVRADIVEMDSLLDGLGETHARLSSLRAGVEDLERARRLADLLVQQLRAARARDSQRLNGASDESLRSASEELRDVVDALGSNLGDGIERIDRELRQVRETAQHLRLVPVETMFTDLERAARDVAISQGKRVVFEGRGGDVRLDADVIAGAQTALQQIVRNAVAHGIEPASDREAAGKAPDGRVVVTVQRHGRRVRFTCRDDGRGVDVDAVRKALQRTGRRTDALDNLGPEALIDVLFEGGISTSGSVTEVSGRGIGLDIVRESTARLGGELSATTQAGAGTTVELIAPVSLVAFEALVVESGGIVATIPLDAIRGTLRVPPDDITPNGQRESLMYDGTVVPFLRLAASLTQKTASARDRRAWPVVIVGGLGGTAAIGVHRLIETANVVMRPLPALAPASPIVAGVSIDSEGNPQLVLDPDGLVTEAQRAREPELEVASTMPTILVVDDSLTTRMLERSILESAGYDVDVASSGEEALVKARSKRYGLFLVDIEMPGIDGLAFVEETRADPTLRDLPCILVSSRATAEDRQRGYDAGARGYVAKSEFDQGELLERIRELMVV